MSDPEQLIDERVPTRFLRYLTSQLNRSRFKKSGEFDRLRRELLAEFQRSVRPPPSLSWPVLTCLCRNELGVSSPECMTLHDSDWPRIPG